MSDPGRARGLVLRTNATVGGIHTTALLAELAPEDSFPLLVCTLLRVGETCLQHEEKVRSFLIIAGLIVWLIWLGYTVEVCLSPRCPPQDNRAQQTMDDAWRRTADGWELNTSWRIHELRQVAKPHAALIHPGLIASFLVLASLGGLLAFSNTQRSDANHR